MNERLIQLIRAVSVGKDPGGRVIILDKLQKDK